MAKHVDKGKCFTHCWLLFPMLLYTSTEENYLQQIEEGEKKEIHGMQAVEQEARRLIMLCSGQILFQR